MSNDRLQGKECSRGCGCGSGISRRDLLRWTGAGAMAWSTAGWPVMAGPFDDSDFAHLVPEDKKLDPNWIASLLERGTPTVYCGDDLQWIGMPIGGLCAGQVYLGGDGTLWHWDIFNQQIGTGPDHYANPLRSASPFGQGFHVRAGDDARPLDRTGFADIRFRGEYPMATVEYRDPDFPLTVSMEAFSPFIPLNVEDSSLPATVLRFTAKNHGADDLEVELEGWLDNAICLHTGKPGLVVRRNRILQQADSLQLVCSAAQPPRDEPKSDRSDVAFENWDHDKYESWTTTGDAFGAGPVRKSDVPSYQGDVGGPGRRIVNSHASAPGASVEAKDSRTGTLTSAPFTIERNYITFWIGGGSHAGQTCLNLLVDDQVVQSATGRNDNRMRPDQFDARPWQGKTARLQIVDQQTGAWGNVGVGPIDFSDKPVEAEVKLQDRHDYGTMALALLDPQPDDRGLAASQAGQSPDITAKADRQDSGEKPFAERLHGSLARTQVLKPGDEAVFTFVIAWHFPNDRIDGVADTGRHYAIRFADASAVVDYVARHFEALDRQTRLWRDTWYDSTLPYWFLDRTFLNTSILATSTCHQFGSGRFYGWEGVGCCPGTCTHVWQYAQAVARLFPALERDLRERTDFGIAFDETTGVIRFRAEGAGLAVDGQSGCILRSYREHLMSPDDGFLKRNWPRIKQALQCLMNKDTDANGFFEDGQHNTLDADWYGPVAWLSGVYLAALRAGEAMALELGDESFARRCRQLFETGQRNLVSQLFEGEYFINKPDPNHPEAINSGTGCEIDQVFGQSWAWQVGLGRVLPEQPTHSALHALWRYNFTPDVGPYREVHKPGRWYAMAGEAGLLMCTFPRQDWSYEQAAGKGPNWAAGYFNECMNGFEYQVAGHMIWEGMVQHGLAVARAVHDRYHPARRNPWNEVECGDHYARSMASYGVFLAACGFEYHGPRGHIGFAPRLSPEDFRAAFTAAEGWGTYRQRLDGSSLECDLTLHWGKLRVRTLAFAVPREPSAVRVTVNGRPVAASHTWLDERVNVSLAQDAHLTEGQQIEVAIG